MAAASRVSVFVIDWTTTGEPPPIGTPPTITGSVERRGAAMAVVLRSVGVVPSAVCGGQPLLTM